MERGKQSWEGPSLDTGHSAHVCEAGKRRDAHFVCQVSYACFWQWHAVCPGSGMKYKEREGPVETKKHRSHSGVLLVETSCFILVRKSLELKETLRSKSA